MNSNKNMISSKKAVALTYSENDLAPRISASGNGIIAENIINKAKEHGIFVHESKELVSLLIMVDLDDHIPTELYRAIAELLAWVHRLEKDCVQN